MCVNLVYVMEGGATVFQHSAIRKKRRRKKKHYIYTAANALPMPMSMYCVTGLAVFMSHAIQ